MEPAPAGLIHKAIVAIMATRPSVAKNRRNEKQGYAFRGIDDFYEELQAVMAEHGVHAYPARIVDDTLMERKTEKGGTIIHVRQKTVVRFQHAEDASYVDVEVIGEAMDFGGDKASNKAMSAAMKYALRDTFLIPTGERTDTENDSPEAGPAEPAKSRPGRAQRPPAEPAPAEPPPAEEGLPMVPVMGKALDSGVWTVVSEAPKLSAKQQARIKILQKEMGIEDKAWREGLFSWCGKSSSAELSATEADGWIALLERKKRSRSSKAPT